MKTLKATMRENKRYLLVHGKNLKENIEKSILEFVGILGMSKCGLSFIKAITHSDYLSASGNTKNKASPNKKMKTLKPTMRENKRYLLVHGKNLKENIEKSVLEFVGILGMSKCGLSFIKTENESAIICINREMVDSVRASFAVFPEKISVERVSGTLKGLRGK